MMTTTTDEDDSELQHAIQASLMVGNNNNTHKNAGRAAAATRTTTTSTAPEVVQIVTKMKKNGLTTTHPKVQMPKRLSQHDQEDVILRCVNRVAPYSFSVDTLLRSLKTIQSNPSNRKFHTVNTSTVTFQRSLTAPGVLDLLKALNFHPHHSPTNTTNFENNNNQIILTLSHYDAAAFYLGISALEQIQQTSPEYARHKALRLFQKELAPALNLKIDDNDNDNKEEASARKRYLS
ncbi:hypothetical protein FRACYDRAFT_268880, partial [Fragilariopsis cylindrus CCMP1102]